ncbi:MAG: hypothetical protein GDA66_18645 [Nitrospira sp. CR1.2]|nr:hypothetical protein [Nitrospira sp. CR1.2]
MATSTYTTTATRTFTHTATHLAGIIASALAETLITIGISVEKASRVYGYEATLSAWIEEQSLGVIRITTTPPGGIESPAYSFDIDYTCQRSVGSPRWWSWFVPGDGRVGSPGTATWFPALV